MKYRLQLVPVSALLTVSAAWADPSINLSGTEDNANLAFVGDTSRLGIGIDDDGDWLGEYFHVFGDGEHSNWVGEVWANDEEAGGLKFGYHWISGAEGLSEINNADDLWVGKLFLAADQNEEDDRKATLGFGYENSSVFWGAYFMKSLTDERLVSEITDSFTRPVTETIGNEVFQRDDIVTNTFRAYEHPYDRGIGLRLGKFFDDGLWRVRGGLDYEEGDFSSDQVTASIGLEKYFANSRHSLALNAEYYERNGDFVLDRDDTRATLTWRYNFGDRHRPAFANQRNYVERTVEKQIPATAAVTERKRVANEITIGETTLFDLDKSAVKANSAELLDTLWSKINSLNIDSAIEVVGHTCDLGTESYNQGLSERRAQAVVDYLVSRGADRSQLVPRGAGELQPRYPNTAEDRHLNRRVEINFVSSEPRYEEVVIKPAVPARVETETIREPVADVAWVTRALRNPVQHKRRVDVYRFEEVDEQVTTGTPVLINVLPTARDDVEDTPFETPVTVQVLNNDSDDALETVTIVANSAPSNGAAEVNADQTITYTPNAGFFGTDTFTYTIQDALGSEATATVTINVSELPPLIALDDTGTTNRNQPVDIEVAGNDSGTDFSVTDVGTPTNGTVQANGSTVTYTPNRDFVGSDAFTYTITDVDGQTATATVTVTVNAANQNPIANDDTGETAKETPVVIDVLANDTDADDDALTIVSVDPAVTEFGTIEIVDNQILYTPNPNWWGGDEFTYTIEDGFGGSDTATVVLTVVP